MKVILHRIAKRDDGDIDLLVSYGRNEPKAYRVNYVETDRAFCCGTDDELFFLLSGTAHKRFGNCAVYQMELTGIIRAFGHVDQIPDLPIELGTTSFCTLRPTLPKVWWNKFWILLLRLGLYRPRIEKMAPP